MLDMHQSHTQPTFRFPLQDHLLEVLQPGLPERSYTDGELLLRQGEQGTFMLYIMQGKVEVTVRLAAPKDPTRWVGCTALQPCRHLFCV